MPYLLILSILMLSACGPPLAQGLWLVSEQASHDCLTDERDQLLCSTPEELDKTISTGLIRVDTLPSGRLRVIDLQGHSIPGRAYSDGAVFRWYQQNQQADCKQTLNVELSLKIVDEHLSGFRQESSTRSADCNQAGLHDQGFVLEGDRYEETAQ